MEGQDQFGLCCINKKASIPLKDVTVEAEIQGYVLGLKSTLKYFNDSSDPAEVVFRFPVEQSHAVVGLTAVINERRIKAQVREKEEARAAYDDAIASGQSAALAEEKSGDVFSISLGNLPPQKEAEIQLQLVGELPIDADGSVRFSLPSTLKPRYTPSGSSDPLASISSGDQSQVEHRQVSSVRGFQLTIFNANDVAEVTSPTHQLLQTPNAAKDRLAVLLLDARAPEKDVVVLIKHKALHSPKALIETGEASSGSKRDDFMSSTVIMVNFFPEIEYNEQACEFVFLVDRSGSMRGSFIKSARETLMLFLKSLPESSTFNIVGFGSRYEKLFPKSVAYSQESLDKATSHVQRLEADLGGTELLSPLSQIFCEKSSGLPRQVFVLTDGAVSNTDACIREVKKNVSTSRCFTFGIGSGASTALVEGLARAGNGSAEFVKEGERLQPKVIRSLKRSLQPAVTDISVEFKVPSEFTVTQSPQNIPAVFKGEKLVVYGILKPKGEHRSRVASGTATLIGKLSAKSFKHSVPFTFNHAPDEVPSLLAAHSLAAKALLRDWGAEHKRKEDIVKLSIESNVISLHTAFIAVDEENMEPIPGAMKSWDLQAQYAGQRMFRMSGVARGRGGGLVASKVMKKSAASAPMAKRKMNSSGLMKVTARSLAADTGFLVHSPEVPNVEGISAVNSSIAVASPVITLSSFIDVQQANGSWKLDTNLARLLKKSIKDIEDVCPTDHECKGVLADVWATVLVLVLLRNKYNAQQEEWELIGMKADSWVKKQALPTEVSLQELFSAATKIVLSM